MKCCYVSMYYDIKRSGWAKFSRTFDDYLSYFAPYVDLFKAEEEEESGDHMIVYIDDRYIDKLQALTRNSKNISLIPINEAFLEHNIPCWKFLGREREIMNSKFFQTIVATRQQFPECQYPEYTLINHSKIDFIIYTLNTDLTSADFICWTDFGFFSRKENIPKRLLNLGHFDRDSINYTLVNPVEDIDRDVYYTLRYAPEKVGGFFFIGRPQIMYQYQRAYHKSLKDYRDKNICDDDQAMTLHTYFENPGLITFNTREYGWHRVYKANEKKKKTKKKNKVISFCLWGDKPRYRVGLLENIKLSRKYYPEWDIYVYVHQDSLFPELKNQQDIIIIIKQDDYRNHPKKCMLWRLEPIMDPTVDVFISRDVDTRIQLREVMAVREWLDDDSKLLHIMRDHPQHYNKILGGMYGVRTQTFRKFDWKALIDTYYRVFGASENDQHFLEKYLYNMTTRQEKMIHDEIKLYEGPSDCRPFPLKYELSRFVGCYVYEDDSNDQPTEAVLKNYLLQTLPHRIHNDPQTIADKLEYINKTIHAIYIIHYTKLTERRAMMTKQIHDLGLDLFFEDRIIWVTDFDREVITIEADLYSPIINRMMSPGEIANMKAHAHVLKECRGISLVIEDDCIFKTNFVDNLHRLLVLLQQQNDWDMCCLGGPTVLNTYPALAMDKSIKDVFSVDEIEIFTPSTPAPCTVSSMLYNEKGVKKILASSHIVGYPQCPSDHALWLANMECGVDMKWVQPFLSYEGSKTDMFQTSFTERGF